MKVVRKGTTSARALKIGLALGSTNCVGLPVRISNTTYAHGGGAGGQVLAIVDRNGVARTAAQVTLRGQRNALANPGGAFTAGVHHVFFDFDKVAAF